MVLIIAYYNFISISISEFGLVILGADVGRSVHDAGGVPRNRQYGAIKSRARKEWSV